MKKFLLSFLCFLLAVGGGYAEEVKYSYTFTAKQFSANGTKKLGNFEWTLSGSGGNYWGYDATKGQQFGKADAPYKSMSLSTSGIEGTIKKIVIKTSGASSVNGSFTVLVGDIQYGSTTKLTATNTAYTFTGAASGKVEFKYTQTSSKALYVKSIEITYENGPVKEIVATPVISPASQEFKKGETVSVSISTETEGATIYYTTNGTTPSASNGTKYEDSFEVNSTTTVKAIAVKEGCSDSEVASATYTMVDPNVKTGTISFANTTQRVSQTTSQQVWSHEGITLTNNKANSTSNIVDSSNPVKLYAHSEVVLECSAGNMTQILFDCNNNDDYATALKNSIGDAATVTVSGDKVTVILDGTSNRFTISDLTAQVRLDALTVTYTAGETKPVAPILTASGNFVGSKEIEISCATEGAKIYYTTDDSEPTKDSGEYIGTFVITSKTTVKAIAINDFGASEVVAATYTRVAASPTITFDGIDTYTIEPAEGTAIYYTLDGSEPNNNSDECPKTITLKANATLKVIAYEGEYKSNIVEQKFTLVAESSTGTATLVTNAADLAAGDQVVIVASGYDFALSTDQRDNNRGQVAITKEGEKVTLNDDVQRLTLEEGTKDGTYAFSTGSGYLYAASSSSNHLKTQTTNNANSSWAITIDGNGVATIKAQGANTRNWLMYNFNSDLFSCYSSGQQGVSLYEVTQIEDPILNVTSAGWATLYLGYNVEIHEDVTCYVVSEVGEESVQLTEVTGVLPANTAVIVKADEGEYEFKVTDVTATAVSQMEGSVKNEYIKEEAYVLGKVGNEVGLYKAEMMGGVFLNNANKAYLPVSALPTSVQNAKALKFNFDTTGVEDVKVETEGKKVIYDLSGRRVNEMAQPGIYIVNGKKVMVK